MNELVNAEFLTLINENSQKVTDEEIKNAYESFVTKVLTLNQSEQDYQTIYRSLSLTRIEFMALQSFSKFEQGKKCA